MAKYVNNNPIDYRYGGDKLSHLTTKYIATMEYIFNALNELKSPQTTSFTEPEAYQFHVTDNKLYIRNGDNSEWIYLMDITLYGGFKDNMVGKLSGGTIANRPTTGNADYDLYWCTDGRVYQWLNNQWNIFMSKNIADLEGYSNMLTMDDVATSANQPNKIMRTDSLGKIQANITGSPDQIAGIDIYAPAVSDNQVLTYNATRNRWEVKNRGEVQENDVSTTGEPNKIVKADATGAITNDTKGNAAKIATKTIDVSNLQDGDVLVYDATTGTFKNKQGAVVNAQGVVEANVSGSAQKWAGKALQTVGMTDGQILVWSESLNAFINRNQSAVGNARALSLRQDGVELANYNGDEYRAVNIITPHLRVGGQAYTEGQTCFSSNMPLTTYLECVTPGVTANVEPDFSTAAVGDVVADGGAEWKVCGYVNSEVTDALNTRLASEEAITAHDFRQPSTTYEAGQIAYHASLPTGWYLECTTDGTSDSGDLTISGPAIGSTVTDGTVVWMISRDLPVSGGAMTGAAPKIRKIDNNGLLQVCGGSLDSKGSFLTLSGEDAQDSQGLFNLTARTSNAGAALVGKPDFTLTWNDNDLAGSAIVAKSLGTNGYIKYASGLIMQWGSIAQNSGNAYYVTFPISFPTIVPVIMVSKGGSDGPTANVSVDSGSTDKAGFHFYYSATPSAGWFYGSWFAIGY